MLQSGTAVITFVVGAVGTPTTLEHHLCGRTASSCSSELDADASSEDVVEPASLRENQSHNPYAWAGLVRCSGLVFNMAEHRTGGTHTFKHLRTIDRNNFGSMQPSPLGPRHKGQQTNVNLVWFSTRSKPLSSQQTRLAASACARKTKPSRERHPAFPSLRKYCGYTKKCRSRRLKCGSRTMNTCRTRAWPF